MIFKKRLYQHQTAVVKSFTQKYHLDKLLYFEIYQTAEEAITREKQLKHWNRRWKLELIKKTNPYLKDLSSEVGGSSLSRG